MFLVLNFWVLSYLLFKDLSYPKRTLQKGEEVSHWHLDIGEAECGQVFLSNTARFCVLVLFCYFLFLLLPLDLHCWWASLLIRLVLTTDAGHRRICLAGQDQPVPGRGAQKCHSHHSYNSQLYVSTCCVQAIGKGLSTLSLNFPNDLPASAIIPFIGENTGAQRVRTCRNVPESVRGRFAIQTHSKALVHNH